MQLAQGGFAVISGIHLITIRGQYFPYQIENRLLVVNYQDAFALSLIMERSGLRVPPWQRFIANGGVRRRRRCMP